jgi:hypothetical protein
MRVLSGRQDASAARIEQSRQQLRIVGGIYRVAHQRAAQGVPEPAGSGRVPHHAIDFFHPLSKR